MFFTGYASFTNYPQVVDMDSAAHRHSLDHPYESGELIVGLRPE